MKIIVQINLEDDDSRRQFTLTRESAAQLVFDALGGDANSDTCSCYITAPVTPHTVGFVDEPVPLPPIQAPIEEPAP